MENRTFNRTTGWIPGFLLRDAAWPDAAATGLPRFVCLSPGEFGPVAADATWTLRLGSPEQLAHAECRLCCRGARMRLGTMAAANICLGSEGVLLGRLPAGMSPTLFSVESDESGEDGDIQYVQTGGELVLLLTRPEGDGLLFALAALPVTERHLGAALVRAALEETEPAAALDAEFQTRDAALPHLERDDPAAALALEVLIGNLRPPTQRIPSRWCATPGSAGDMLDLNETLPQIFAWLKIDPAVASDLLRACIATQRPDGLLPARIDPRGILPPSTAAAWPLFALACLECFDQTRDFSLTEEITPQLREYSKALPARYQQVAGDIPCWPTADDALVPELWDERLASTDLTAILVIELGALCDLFNRVPGPGIDLSHLQAQRAQLETALTAHFWNAPERVFTDRYLTGQGGASEGGFIRRVSLGSYLPLGIRDLGAGYRDALLHHLDGAASLLTTDGLQHWQSWEEDEDLPGVDALVQSVAFVLLRPYPPAMVRLRRSLEETQRHLLSCGVAFPRDLRLVRNEEGQPLTVSGAPRLEGCSAALFLLISASEQSMISAIETAPAPIRFLERHRNAIIYSVISVFILLLFGIPSCLIRQSEYRGKSIYLKTTEAETAYKMGHYDRAIELYEELIQLSEDETQRNTYQLSLARMHFSKKDYARASERYARVAAAMPEDAKVRLNLGLSQYRERRYTEAFDSLELAQKLAGEKNPEIAEKALEALLLITPKLPPKATP